VRVARGVTVRVARGVTVRVARGVTARVARGVTVRVARGVTVRVARGVTVRVARGVTVRVARGVTVRVARGVTVRVARGVTVRVARGVTARVAFFESCCCAENSLVVAAIPCAALGAFGANRTVAANRPAVIIVRLVLLVIASPRCYELFGAHPLVSGISSCDTRKLALTHVDAKSANVRAELQ
jgi:hypothetical protein